jgi:outer membrane protein assembly factor BamD
MLTGPRLQRMKKILLLSLSLLLASCAGTELLPSESAKQDYEKAKAMLDNGDYDKASLFLESFSAQHPYSQYAVQAELLRAFAAYKIPEYILAETLSEQFVKRHPRHPDVAYAKYLLAMSHFRQITNIEHDQTQTRLSIEAFERLLKEDPRSNYAKDGAARLQSLYNMLASHELTVGKYYFNKERYVAALNRFQGIVKKHQTTPAIEEALYYLAASYAKLGISAGARDSAILLRHNYPKSEWSSKAAEFL